MRKLVEDAKRNGECNAGGDLDNVSHDRFKEGMDGGGDDYCQR